MRNILIHHGIKGQQWGIRRYQNEDGSLTELGKDRRANYATAEDWYNADARRTHSDAYRTKKAYKEGESGITKDDYKEAKLHDKSRKLLTKYTDSKGKETYMTDRYVKGYSNSRAALHAIGGTKLRDLASDIAWGAAIFASAKMWNSGTRSSLISPEKSAIASAGASALARGFGRGANARRIRNEGIEDGRVVYNDLHRKY